MSDRKEVEYKFDSEKRIIDNIRYFSTERNDNCDKIKIHACDIRNSGLLSLINSYYYKKDKDSPDLEELNNIILEILMKQKTLFNELLINKQLKN